MKARRKSIKLNLGNKNASELKFHEIEGSVEEFKRNALPDITEDLLKKAQNDYKEEIKKKKV